MLKKVGALLALGLLYRTISKDFSESDLFNVELIDKEGNWIGKKPYNDSQKKAITNFSMFAYRLKLIVRNNPIVKGVLLAAITSSIFLKESSENEPFICDFEGEVGLAIPSEYHLQHGVIEVVTESCSKVVSKNRVRKMSTEEVTTGAMASYEKPIMRIIKRKKRKNS